MYSAIDNILTYVRTDVEITVTDDAESWLAKSGFNPQFGARPLKRLIQNKSF